MDSEVIIRRPIISYRRGQTAQTDDSIVKEFPLAIFLNGTEIISLMCLPQDMQELAIGFLYSEGLIDDNTVIESIEESIADGHVHVTADYLPPPRTGTKRIITSGCGKGSIFQQSLEDIKFIEIKTETSLKPETIIDLINEMQSQATIFRQTGGVHSCALAAPDGSISHFFEDIGRHNAIDKIFGACFMEKRQLDSSIILTSGRISSEIVIKVAKRRVPFIVSRAAPTDFALDLAGELGICVVGFLRGQRFSIYTKSERISFERGANDEDRRQEQGHPDKPA